MNENARVWLALMALSLSSFSISETAQGKAVAGIVLGTAGLKAGLLAWRFMELRLAHSVWKFALFALLAGFLSLVYLLLQW